MKVAEYQQTLKGVRMEAHDTSSTDQRMRGYAGIGIIKIMRDPNWNRPNKPAPKPRYRLSPAQLRRMGIGR